MKTFYVFLGGQVQFDFDTKNMYLCLRLNKNVFFSSKIRLSPLQSPLILHLGPPSSSPA